MSNFTWRTKSLSRRDTTSSQSSVGSVSSRASTPSPGNDREHSILAGLGFRNRRVANLDDMVYYNYMQKAAQDLGNGEQTLKHWIHRQVWKGTTAPAVASHLQDGKNKVLDIGCSTGSWLLDIADEYPQAVFIGIDNNPEFPSNDKQPSNAAFIECNVLDGIPFPDDIFDFVHQSGMFTTYTISQWRLVLKDIARVTKPGGWIELMELDFRYKSLGPTTKRLNKALITYLDLKGIVSCIVPYLEGFLREAGGLSEIKVEERTAAAWGGGIGESIQKDLINLFTSMSKALAPFMNLTCAEYDLLVAKIPKECNEYRTSCSYFRIHAKKFRPLT